MTLNHGKVSLKMILKVERFRKSRKYFKANWNKQSKANPKATCSPNFAYTSALLYEMRLKRNWQKFFQVKSQLDLNVTVVTWLLVWK